MSERTIVLVITVIAAGMTLAAYPVVSAILDWLA